MRQYVNELIALDVIVIAASGNDNRVEVAVCRPSKHALGSVN